MTDAAKISQEFRIGEIGTLQTNQHTNIFACRHSEKRVLSNEIATLSTPTSDKILICADVIPIGDWMNFNKVLTTVFCACHLVRLRTCAKISSWKKY